MISLRSHCDFYCYFIIICLLNQKSPSFLPRLHLHRAQLSTFCPLTGSKWLCELWPRAINSIRRQERAATKGSCVPNSHNSHVILIIPSISSSCWRTLRRRRHATAFSPGTHMNIGQQSAMVIDSHLNELPLDWLAAEERPIILGNSCWDCKSVFRYSFIQLNLTNWHGNWRVLVTNILVINQLIPLLWHFNSQFNVYRQSVA